MTNIKHDDLSGTWLGQFSYTTSRFRPEFFTANLFEEPKFLGGSIHEVAMNGKFIGKKFYATISGKREGSTISFTKSYETAPRSHQIYYTGTVNAEFTEIEGTWHGRGEWSGRFLMIRNRGLNRTAYKSIMEYN